MRTSNRIHDEHVHLRPHGVRPLPAHRLAPMAAACAERGVELGIREHAPLPRAYRLGPDEDYLFCMREDEVDAFLGELEGTGAAVGFEIDHIDGCEVETQAIVRDLCDRARARGIPIGGLTGSVHFVPGNVDDLGSGVDKRGVPHILCDYLDLVMRAHVEDRGEEAAVRDYFGCVRRCIATGFYDVIGHLELVRKWDRPGQGGESTLFSHAAAAYAEELEATIRLAGEASLVLEYNTSGRDIHFGRPYLSDEAVRACVRHRVPIALSSDAHLPKHVARHFGEAVAKLRSLGVRELVAVRNRQRIVVPIS